jgi:hypothetical protein
LANKDGGIACRNALYKLGKDATYQQVAEELRQTGVTVKQNTFNAIKSEIYPAYLTKVRKCAETIIRELGPECTFEQVKSRMELEGETLSNASFSRFKRVCFMAPAEKPMPVEQKIDLHEYLLRLAKFSAVVHDMGGVAQVRRMLNEIERMHSES